MKEVHTNQQGINRLIDLALDGNAEGLEQLLVSVRDMIFNLSLRMLGAVPDAEEDALLDDPEAFIRYATERFLCMKPFNNYLNRALAHFTMPER